MKIYLFILLLITGCGIAGGNNCPIEDGTLRELNTYEFDVWNLTVDCLLNAGLPGNNFVAPSIARTQDRTVKGLSCGGEDIVLISQKFIDNQTNAQFPQDYDVLIKHEFKHEILKQAGVGNRHQDFWFVSTPQCEDNSSPELPGNLIGGLF